MWSTYSIYKISVYINNVKSHKDVSLIRNWIPKTYFRFLEKVFEIEPEDQIIPLHSTATITMTCKANIPNPKYTWMKDLVVLEDDTSKYQLIFANIKVGMFKLLWYNHFKTFKSFSQ